MTYRSIKKTFQNFKPIHIGAMLMMPAIVIPMLYFADTQKAPPSNISSNKSSALAAKASSPDVDFGVKDAFPTSSQKQGTPQKLIPNPTASTTLAYNVTQVPALKGSQSLQRIVDGAVESFQAKGLPTDKLSISLINVKNPQCQVMAQFQDRQPRFPASISKLFWMVALYGQIKSNTLQTPIDREVVRKMIQKSDNESASDIVDAITRAESGDRLAPEQLSQWDAQRKSINTFFNAAGYQSVDVSQKNFPIPKLQMLDPKGRDLQIRGDERSPIRNSLTTYDVSRLAYEIHSRKAVSSEKSEIMESLMVRDLRPEVWKQEQYNSIQGFLAEKLPLDTYVASKVGWTAGSRQDVAIVQSEDRSAHYILTIFGDDKKYADDWDIFPAVSRQIFEQIKLQDSSNCGSIS